MPHSASVVAGMLPERGSLELPPAQWLEQMRTPPAEILLAEFRQQQGHAVEAQPDESGHVLMDSNEQKSAVIRGIVVDLYWIPAKYSYQNLLPACSLQRLRHYCQRGLLLKIAFESIEIHEHKPQRRNSNGSI